MNNKSIYIFLKAQKYKFYSIQSIILKIFIYMEVLSVYIYLVARLDLTFIKNTNIKLNQLKILEPQHFN